MKIVAFLQNMWVRSDRTKAQVERWDPVSDQRERMIAYALFAGCLTGRRLKQALGTDLCQQIIWQEASPQVTTDPKLYCPPDDQHIKNVLQKHQPTHVVCFTETGYSAIWRMCELRRNIICIRSCHPAARGPLTMAKVEGVRYLLTGTSPLPGMPGASGDHCGVTPPQSP